MNMDSVVFIGGFLPVIVLLYTLIPGIRSRNILLLAAGMVFYAFSGVQGLLLLIAAAALNYLLGFLVRKKWALILGIAANLAFLAAYKYLSFFLRDILGMDTLNLSLTAPIGISFFTFRAISYLIDTYRAPEEKCRNFFSFLLYISFFPQIMAGPIMRYGSFAAQLQNRSSTPQTIARGVRRFVVGLSKKMLLCSVLGSVADATFAAENLWDFRLAWLGAVAYSLQIYLDFSGYSDMAIGLGNIFGFAADENFRYPYAAKNLGDFWRRWHISLSSWFKDYVYIPLGGNRRGKLRAGVNKLIVFSLCGVWHGASWTFLVWGVWHGLLGALESLNVIPAKRLQKTKILGGIYTLLVVCLGFVMFRAASVQQGFSFIGAMFAGFAFTAESTAAIYSLFNAQTVSALLLGIVAAMPIAPKWSAWVCKRPWVQAAQYAAVLILFVLCLLKLASTGFTPFIYAQF